MTSTITIDALDGEGRFTEVALLQTASDRWPTLRRTAGYGATPPARRTRNTSDGIHPPSSSQFTVASSQPASQLLDSQSQSQLQAESQPQEEGISAPRLQLFQTALGQLIDGPLFANDAADVEPLVAAVNARLTRGQTHFESAEAEAALQELNEKNKIMYSGGIVYKI